MSFFEMNPHNLGMYATTHSSHGTKFPVVKEGEARRLASLVSLNVPASPSFLPYKVFRNATRSSFCCAVSARLNLSL